MPCFANNSFLKYNWPSIFWAAFILVLCLMPGRELPSVSIWEFDKLVHFCFYFVLALLMFWGWKKQKTFPSLQLNLFLKILTLTFSYGFVVEILQELLTTDRHFELFDALANSAGATAGCLISVKLFR
jgi:VanZ family protein